jgi:D-3-phosphoglycerate dehydrogenase / 2-oxoglutarate reductase
MSREKVLIAAPVHAVLATGLREAGYELIFEEQITQERAYFLIKDCVGVVTSTRLQLDASLIDAAPLLQWIGRMGSGMEVIDVMHAQQRGIRCFSSPEGNSNAVAEHALGMLLSLTKRITWSHHEVQQGKWLREENRGIELAGKTVGIIGFGHTGRAFAKKLSSMDMRILAYDKYQRGDLPPYVEGCNDLSLIFEHAQIVSFHVPLQADTSDYFNDAFLSAMRQPFILINTSRGRVVNTPVLHEGLISGKIMGACLDVIEGEPLDKMTPVQLSVLQSMMRLPQVIVTPHIAGYSVEALYKMSTVLLDKIVIAG